MTVKELRENIYLEDCMAQVDYWRKCALVSRWLITLCFYGFIPALFTAWYLGVRWFDYLVIVAVSVAGIILGVIFRAAADSGIRSVIDIEARKELN
jgi:hypothetical protein